MRRIADTVFLATLFAVGMTFLPSLLGWVGTVLCFPYGYAIGLRLHRAWSSGSPS